MNSGEKNIVKKYDSFIDTNQEVADSDYGERSEKAQAVVNEFKELLDKVEESKSAMKKIKLRQVLLLSNYGVIQKCKE